jgi:hypothetical protein
MREALHMHYFERRAEEERLAAMNATDERAAQTHRALAARYYAKAKGGPVHEADGDEAQDTGTLSREFRILP